MRKYLSLLIIVIVVSCNNRGGDNVGKIITVSIAPFKYFIDEIGGDDFTVNIMVLAGADPHIYEPIPSQISQLELSDGYISNGLMDFEMIWLDRFYEINKTMKRLSIADMINPLIADHNPERDHFYRADPHYWVSPKCGMIIASSVMAFLCELNPTQTEKYETNYHNLIVKIKELDARAELLFSEYQNRSFMIYHPILGYIARDYGLKEISLEYEGKEPSPLRMKELIDSARKDGLNTIFVQREYDIRNAQAIADEVGAVVKIIDPLSEDWLGTTLDIINAIHLSLTESSK